MAVAVAAAGRWGGVRDAAPTWRARHGEGYRRVRRIRGRGDRHRGVAMTVVSVHIADVGLPKSLDLIRHPRPGSIPGLLQATSGIAAKFGTTPARPSPGRVGLIAFWQNEAALKEFETTHPLAA